MFYIQQQIEKRNIFIISLITFLCITVLLFANPITWAKVYSAIDAVLNTITTINLLTGQIKNLEEKVKDLTATRDKKNDIYVAYSTNLVFYIKKMNEYRIAYNNAELAYNTATEEIKKAKDDVAEKKSSYDKASYYRDWYLRDYMNHISSCDYCNGSAMCAEGQRLYDNWQASEETLKQAKRDYDDAKSKLEGWERAQSTAKGKMIGNNMWMDNMNNMIAKIGPYVVDLGEEIAAINTDLDPDTPGSKAAELEAKKKERKELNDSMPGLTAYMDKMVEAWSQANPDFDWDQYFRDNPIPDIIQ